MVELVGDNCEPLDLRLPTHDARGTTSRAGDIFISGSKIWFDTGSAVELVTSG